MTLYIKYLLFLVIGLAIGCTGSAINKKESPTFSEKNQPQNVYLDKDVKSSIDSMYVYYEPPWVGKPK